MNEITLHIGDTVQLNMEVISKAGWMAGDKLPLHVALKLISIVEQQDGTLALVLGHDGDS